MNPNWIYVLAIFSLFSTGCMVTPYVHPESSKWDTLLTSPQYQEEKKLFEQRTGGIKYCGDIGVTDFIINSRLKPDKLCIYPASPLIVEYKNNPYVKRNLRQAIQALKVMQVAPNGFIVETTSEHYTSNVVFIHKTDEINLVDGSYLDEKSWIMYEYMGPYTYKTLAGSKTVHSFKKVANDRFKKEFKGIKNYGPLNEYLIKNQLYDWVKEK